MNVLCCGRRTYHAQPKEFNSAAQKAYHVITTIADSTLKGLACGLAIGAVSGLAEVAYKAYTAPVPDAARLGIENNGGRFLRGAAHYDPDFAMHDVLQPSPLPRMELAKDWISTTLFSVAAGTVIGFGYGVAQVAGCYFWSKAN